MYVDVRSGPDGCENRSAAISHQLANLGATVSHVPSGPWYVLIK